MTMIRWHFSIAISAKGSRAALLNILFLALSIREGKLQKCLLLQPFFIEARHSGFFHNFCFASKHQAFISWVAKVIFRRRQLMIWASKVIFFFAFFAIIDQFWCPIISPLLRKFCESWNEGLFRNEKIKKCWKKSTVHWPSFFRDIQSFVTRLCSNGFCGNFARIYI